MKTFHNSFNSYKIVHFEGYFRIIVYIIIECYILFECDNFILYLILNYNTILCILNILEQIYLSNINVMHVIVITSVSVCAAAVKSW